MQTKSFSTLLTGYVTAVQGAAAGLVDFTVGSILLACGEAISQTVLWLQALILSLVALTRAATSQGADLDSFYADFSFFRLPAIKATGVETFARFTTTAAALVPAGAQVQSADGKQVAIVQIDTGNAAWSTPLNGYVLPISTASVDVPVEIKTAGAAGNLAIGQCNTIASSITGIDTATNAAAFTGGADAETDPAFRARFVLYLASLSRATVAAVAKAIESVAGVTDYSITENMDFGGGSDPGNFFAVIDDGTGSPSGGLKTAVAAAVTMVRPIGSTFTIESPSVTTTPAALTITVDPAYNTTATVNAVHAAIIAFINALKLGDDLPYTRIAQIAYDTSAGVLNVTSVTLNGGTSDLTASALQVIRAGTVTVSHT